MDDKPIILSGLNAIHFIAFASFHDETNWRFPQRTKSKIVNKEQSKKSTGNVIHNLDSDDYYIFEDVYKTKEEWYTAMKSYQIARIQYIYNWIQENYPEDNYAEEFLYSKAWGLNDYWSLELGITIDDIFTEGKNCNE